MVITFVAFYFTEETFHKDLNYRRIMFLITINVAKFLIIRFSSIGDIVLTTPVIRCLRKQYPDAEIHFLTKNAFKGIVTS